MGKSAKFYKRPSRKEKEAIALKRAAGITKPKEQAKKKKEAVATATAAVKAAASDKQVSMDVDEVPKNEKKVKKEEKPDYVDLLTGKKTYKKIPAKRK